MAADGFHKVVGVDQGGLKGQTDQVWEFIHPYVHRDHPQLLTQVRRKVRSFALRVCGCVGMYAEVRACTHVHAFMPRYVCSCLCFIARMGFLVGVSRLMPTCSCPSLRACCLFDLASCCGLSSLSLRLQKKGAMESQSLAKKLTLPLNAFSRPKNLPAITKFVNFILWDLHLFVGSRHDSHQEQGQERRKQPRH